MIDNLSGHRYAPVILAVSLSVFAAVPVNAAHTTGTVFVETENGAGVLTDLGPSAFSNVVFRNGEYFGFPFAFGGSFDAGPLTPGATTIFSSADAAFGLASASSYSSASLSTGALRAVTDSTPAPGLVASGSARAGLGDSVYFTNVTGSALPVTLSMRVDGSITGDFSTATFISGISLATTGAGCNASGQCITPLSDGTGAINSRVRGVFISGTPLYFDDYAGTTGAAIPYWTFSLAPGHDNNIGPFDYTKSIQLWVPSGLTTLDLQTNFFVACTGEGNCDFGNTAAVQFGDLPEGLSFTSQSGQFLTDLGGGGAVPEPSTWAMLIAGFGLVGATMRKRRRAIIAA